MKPENVLIEEDGYVRLSDYGIAKILTGQTNSCVGTSRYMAPEVILSGSGSSKYACEVDMWSLGCIIYELLTGKPLFPAKDENELLEYFIVTIG